MKESTPPNSNAEAVQVSPSFSEYLANRLTYSEYIERAMQGGSWHQSKVDTVLYASMGAIGFVLVVVLLTCLCVRGKRRPMGYGKAVVLRALAFFLMLAASIYSILLTQTTAQASLSSETELL